MSGKLQKLVANIYKPDNVYYSNKLATIDKNGIVYPVVSYKYKVRKNGGGDI